MLVDFFFSLRGAEIPVTIPEYLDLVRAMRGGLVFGDVAEFRALARALLVKDERYFARYEAVFEHFFYELDQLPFELESVNTPEEWLRKEFERAFSREEYERLKALPFDELLQTLLKRLAEQRERHAGGNRWIGTGGTSPFGAYGMHPSGIRVGGEGGMGRAAKVYGETPDYGELDPDAELAPRNLRMALRKLRVLARSGSELELDVEETVEATASKGQLELVWTPERRNRVKVLLFIDVGGSMWRHVQLCEDLFSAAQAEFKYLVHVYFHNMIYDQVWRGSNLRRSSRFPLREVINTYGSDYRVIFVGDASMARSEIDSVGGSRDFWNEEPGAVWFQRVTRQWERVIWLNPEPETEWDWTSSIGRVRELVDGHMYPLTIRGLERGLAHLKR